MRLRVGKQSHELIGVHIVRRKIVDGTTRTYYYAWRGGPRITADLHTQAFLDEFNMAHAMREAQEAENEGKYPRGTTGHMLQLYLASPEGNTGVEKTISERRRYIGNAIDKFGALGAKAYHSKAVAQLFYDWRDSMADNPRTADEHMRQLSRAFKWMVKRGLIPFNPIENYEGIYQVDRSDMIFTQAIFRHLLDHSNPALARTYRGVIHLGARMEDLTKLLRSAVEPHQTVFKTGKGRKHNRIAKIPHTPYFRALLAELPRTSVFLFTNTYGQPWTVEGLKTADYRARDNAGLKHLHFHDLRGTAATIRVSQNYSRERIAGMLGWSTKEVDSMLNRYVDFNLVNENWDWAING